MQPQPEPSTFAFGDTEPPIHRGAFVRAARAVAARFMRSADPIEQPFRDSDFEPDQDFLGRPLGEH